MSPSTTPKPEHWLECTFQQGLCGWELSGAIGEEIFYWNRTNGQELESNELLGPIQDHLENKNGKYDSDFNHTATNFDMGLCMKKWSFILRYKKINPS